MLDPNDTNIDLNRSLHDVPFHVLATFLISLTSVVFLLTKIVKQLSVANSEALTAHSDTILPGRKASLMNVSYRKSLRKIRFIKCFKSKTSVKNISDNRKKLKGPLEFKKQLKSLLTNKSKQRTPGKVEQYVVHPSDIKAVLTEDKVNLMKTVQNFLERVVGKPISTLLPSLNQRYLDTYSELCDLVQKASNEKKNIGSQTNMQYKGKAVTWSSGLKDQFRKVLGTNKTAVSEESSTAPKFENPLFGQINLTPENSEVTVKFSQTKKSSESFTTLFPKSSVTPVTSKSSLKQNFEKIPSIRHFQVTLKKFQEESSKVIHSACPSLVGKDKASQPRQDKASNIGNEKPLEYKERLTPLNIDKASKIPVLIDLKNVPSTTDVPTMSPLADPLPLDKSTKVSNAGDAQITQLDSSSSTILFDDFDSNVQFTDSYVSIGFDAGDLSQVPSWHCWKVSK
uniref:Uncharacterized protein n=1 Tax=Cacopsylla melanoneura TaxID=428564 RepID=A0A8D9EYL1_9HEMI